MFPLELRTPPHFLPCDVVCFDHIVKLPVIQKSKDYKVPEQRLPKMCQIHPCQFKEMNIYGIKILPFHFIHWRKTRTDGKISL